MLETNTDNEIDIKRKVMTEDDFDAYRYSKIKVSMKNKLLQKIKQVSKFGCTKENVLKKFEYFFPIIFWLRKYKWKSYLKGDIVSGLTVGIMQISQGIEFTVLR